MNKNRSKFAGLYLFELSVTYWSLISRSTKLLIATRKNSLHAATIKGAKFLKVNSGDYPKAEIKGINYLGVIDA